MVNVKTGGWKNAGPAETIRKLTRNYGPPQSKTDEGAVWLNIAGMDRVEVRDEVIPHDFPAPHKDWLYSTKKIKVNPDHADDYANVTGSIHIDILKGEVTARCQTLDKNADTLGFVERGEAGEAPITKEEYSRVILGDVFPSWYSPGTADLVDTNLIGANLRGANLCKARTGIREIDNLLDKNFCKG